MGRRQRDRRDGPVAAYVEPERLLDAIEQARGDKSLRQVARECHLSPSTITRLADGRHPSAQNYVTLLSWLLQQSPAPGCRHPRVYWVGGVGTLTQPPHPRRICWDCGIPLAGAWAEEP